MKTLALVLFLAVGGCNDQPNRCVPSATELCEGPPDLPGFGADLSVPSEAGTPPDLAAPEAGPPCTLATVNADCAASCGTPDGGLVGSGWPCLSDPLCSNGHWIFGCKL